MDVTADPWEFLPDEEATEAETRESERTRRPAEWVAVHVIVPGRQLAAGQEEEGRLSVPLFPDDAGGDDADVVDDEGDLVQLLEGQHYAQPAD
jgi:hypothetical protein